MDVSPSVPSSTPVSFADFLNQMHGFSLSERATVFSQFLAHRPCSLQQLMQLTHASPTDLQIFLESPDQFEIFQQYLREVVNSGMDSTFFKLDLDLQHGIRAFGDSQWDRSLAELRTLFQVLFDWDPLHVDQLLLEERFPVSFFVYAGHPITPREFVMISRIQAMLRDSLPLVPKITFDTTGFVIHDNHVTELGIYAKNLKWIPAEIFELRQLEVLSLSGMKLTEVPPLIRRLSALRVLNLWQNQIQTIPPEIGSLQALEKVWLNYNRLRTAPEMLNQCSHLCELHLNANPAPGSAIPHVSTCFAALATKDPPCFLNLE